MIIQKENDMKKDSEMCIRDKNHRIVAWKAGLSDKELKTLLEKHKGEGWHISHAEDIGNGYR